MRGCAAPIRQPTAERRRRHSLQNLAAAALYEFAILITAREWTSQYEWYAHYPLAMKAGLDAKVADELALGKRPSAMSDDEAAVYEFWIPATSHSER